VLPSDLVLAWHIALKIRTTSLNIHKQTFFYEALWLHLSIQTGYSFKIYIQLSAEILVLHLQVSEGPTILCGYLHFHKSSYKIHNVIDEQTNRVYTGNTTYVVMQFT